MRGNLNGFTINKEKVNLCLTPACPCSFPAGRADILHWGHHHRLWWDWWRWILLRELASAWSPQTAPAPVTTQQPGEGQGMCGLSEPPLTLEGNFLFLASFEIGKNISLPPWEPTRGWIKHSLGLHLLAGWTQRTKGAGSFQLPWRSAWWCWSLSLRRTLALRPWHTDAIESKKGKQLTKKHLNSHFPFHSVSYII